MINTNDIFFIIVFFVVIMKFFLDEVVQLSGQKLRVIINCLSRRMSASFLRAMKPNGTAVKIRLRYPAKLSGLCPVSLARDLSR